MREMRTLKEMRTLRELWGDGENFEENRQVALEFSISL